MTAFVHGEEATRLLNNMEPQSDPPRGWYEQLRKYLTNMQSFESSETSVWCDVCLMSYLPDGLPAWEDIDKEDRQHALFFKLFDSTCVRLRGCLRVGFSSCPRLGPDDDGMDWMRVSRRKCREKSKQVQDSGS